MGAALPQRHLTRKVPAPQVLLWQLLCQEALGAALVTSRVALVLMVDVPCLVSVELQQGALPRTWVPKFCVDSALSVLLKLGLSA